MPKTKPKKPAGSKVKKDEALAKLEAANMRAREIFTAKRRLVPLSDSDSEEQTGIHKQLQEQQQLIEKLKKQLQERGKYIPYSGKFSLVQISAEKRPDS